MAAQSYATLANVKARLNKSTAGQDSVITTICTQVNEFIESLTGRPIGPDATGSYTIDGYDAIEDGRCILFPRGIRTLTSVTVAPYTGASPVTIPIGDIFTSPNPYQLMPGWPAFEVWMSDIPSTANTQPFFPPGYNNIVLTGTFGWAAIPADLQEVAEVMAVRAYLWRQSGSTDTAGGSDVGSWLSGRDAIPNRDRTTIMRYAWRPVYVD